MKVKDKERWWLVVDPARAGTVDRGALAEVRWALSVTR